MIGGVAVPALPEILDEGLGVVPTPAPAPTYRPRPTDPPVATPAQAVGTLPRDTALTRPASLIWSGMLGLCVATAGLLMVARRRRQW